MGHTICHPRMVLSGIQYFPFFVILAKAGIQNPVRHTVAERHPEPCPSYRRRPVSSIYFFLVPGFRREDDVVVPGFPPSSVESFGLDCLSFYLQPSQKDLSEQRACGNDSSTGHAGMTSFFPFSLIVFSLFFLTINHQPSTINYFPFPERSKKLRIGQDFDSVHVPASLFHANTQKMFQFIFLTQSTQ